MGRIRNALRALRGAPLPEPMPGNSFFLNLPGPFNTRPIIRKPQQADSYLGWVYAATSLIAGDVRSQDWWFHDAEGKEVEVPEASILKRPTVWTTWSDLIELTQLNIDLTGEAFWWLVGAEQFGAVRGIQHIPSSWIIEAWVPGGVFQGWKMQIPGHAEQILPPRDVVWFKNPHPTEPWRAISPVETYALSYNMDIYARAYGAALMQNWAQPPGILTSEQELSGEEADAIRERWKSHRQSAENIAVLGKGAKYEPLSISVKDLAFIELARMTREQILGIYRVPPGKLGLAEEGGTAAEHAARDNTYAKNALLPRLHKLADTINTYVVPRILPRKIIKPLTFAFENPVRKDEAFAVLKAEQGLKSGVITINQYLMETDRDPLPGPEGDLYMLPAGVTLVAKLEDGLSTQVQPVAPEEEEDGDEGQGQEGEERKDEETRLLARAFLPPGILPGLTTKDLDEAEGRYLARQGRIENKLAGEVRRILRREGKAVAESIRLGEMKAAPLELVRGNGSDFVFEWNLAKGQRDLIDDILSRYARQWERELERAAMLGLEDGWNLLAQDAGRALIDFGVFLPQARSIAAANAGKKIVDIRTTTSKGVSRVIADGISSGRGIAEIAASVEALYEGWRGYRAETIARTETAYAVNRGREEHAISAEQRLGVRIYNTWLAVSDDRTRDHHVQANGQRVRQGEYFNVGGAQLLYPGDSDNGAPPEETINCFPADTLVSGSFIAGLSARYAGELVEFHTASGLALRVTPNHPVATPDGFVAANQLRKGDYVIRHCGWAGGQWPSVGARAQKKEQGPSRIGDVFGALLGLGLREQCGIRAYDLHGDGIGVQGDVDVVRPARSLLHDRNPSSAEFSGERVFEKAAPMQALLAGSCALDLSRKRIGLAASGGPGSTALSLDSSSAHGAPFQPLRFGPAANMNAALREHAGYSVSSDAEFIRELFERYAGLVAVDQIVEIRKKDFLGQVFDLQSTGGWMVSQGIVSSNCRCTTVSEVFDT